MKRLLALCLLFVFAISAPASAEELMMTRVMQSFPETMLKLQEVIKQHGYQLSRVQRVDIGLANMGYKTDKYRVVFFGKEAENRWIIDKHPELIAYKNSAKCITFFLRCPDCRKRSETQKDRPQLATGCAENAKGNAKVRAE